MIDNVTGWNAALIEQIGSVSYTSAKYMDVPLAKLQVIDRHLYLLVFAGKRECNIPFSM